MWSPNLTNKHSVIIYVARRCWWTPQLPHSGKYWGSYASSNLRTPGSHSQAIVVPGRCPGTAPHSNCHISYLTPPIEVFLSILESSRHELRIVDGLTILTHSLHGWKRLPSSTLELLGPSHQQCQKSQVSLWGLPCADGVLRTPHGEVCNIGNMFGPTFGFKFTIFFV